MLRPYRRERQYQTLCRDRWEELYDPINPLSHNASIDYAEHLAWQYGNGTTTSTSFGRKHLQRAFKNTSKQPPCVGTLIEKIPIGVERMVLTVGWPLSQKRKRKLPKIEPLSTALAQLVHIVAFFNVLDINLGILNRIGRKNGGLLLFNINNCKTDITWELSAPV